MLWLIVNQIIAFCVMSYFQYRSSQKKSDIDWDFEDVWITVMVMAFLEFGLAAAAIVGSGLLLGQGMHYLGMAIDQSVQVLTGLLSGSNETNEEEE